MSESESKHTPGDHPTHGAAPAHGAGESPVDLNEYGAPRDGVRQVLDKRLFVQLLVFQCGPTTAPDGAARLLAGTLREAGVGAIVYEDVNDPRGLGVVTWTTDPADFVLKARPVLSRAELGLTLRPELSMLGRTYSTGFEQELEYWLLRRPVETLRNPAIKWGIWYPLRRTGSFAKLEPREQGSILREHGAIGRAYGTADHAHDVRLACHGLDTNDNEFVIGLLGKDLYPLSHVVQAMRKTRQTSEFIQQMGPFFVGHVVA